MAGITIAANNLISRATRSGLVQNGVRKINLRNLSQSQESGGIINRILNLGGRLLGFLSAIVGGVSFSVSAVFGWLIARWQQVWNFNWNATDEQLLAAISAQNIGIAAAWGGAFGGTFGWLSTIAVGYGIAYICPVIGGAALAKAIASNVLPEALEEIGSYFQSAVRVTLGSLANRAVINAYMGTRRFLKNAPESMLRTVFGEETAKFIKHYWGNEGEPNISFAEQFENALEELPPTAQAFWEEFFDEAWDSFTEAGYLIASEFDSAIAQAKAGNKLAAGQERVVTIQPDSRVEGEVATFAGAEEEVQTEIQTYLNSYRTIQNRDVGQIVGAPETDWVRAKTQRRKLTIIFKSVERPPFYRREGPIKSATYAIPDPKPNLSWNQIKRAAKFYTWGKFRATANLDNGRQMAVYGATPQEAELKLKDLLDLSTAELVTLSVSEEKERDPRLRKSPTMLYPATGSMLIRIPSRDREGRVDIDGNTWDEQSIRFDLWTDEEPEEFEIVRQLSPLAGI
ncbi:hypothetical protein [Egbenema bharatensis]|uniref:hypothetical protein n=1 Tax=Egbenema bharatensis TaxID=3463334 RepID=UPI003A896C70